MPACTAEHESVVICQMTSDGDEAPDFRVVVEPSPGKRPAHAVPREG